MNVREMREQAGLTQHELADMLGVSQSLVALIESGRRSVTGDMRQRLNDAFNFGISRRMNWREKMRECIESMPALTDADIERYKRTGKLPEVNL